MNPDIAHIVYASDDKFAEILGVSLVSLYENSRDMNDVAVYILDSGISVPNKEKIDSISQKYGRSPIAWIKAQNISELLAMKVAVDRGSLSQYARLFISSDLPADLDRVLYLDCDIVVNKSIRELWNLDLHGKTIAALNDAFSPWYRANIGLQKNDIMFNSGVMLIDLSSWKTQQVEEKLVEFIKSRNGKVQQGDQGALNAILSHDTYCFDPRFNSVTIFFDFTYEEMLVYRKPPKGFYSKKEVERAVENPDIIHFTTSFLSKRPWINGCQHKYAATWLKYKAMSPWKEAKLWDDNRTGWKKEAGKIIKILPRPLMIRLAGLAQAYGRPWWNKIRK